MKATACRDDVTTVGHHSAKRRPQPSIDLSVEARPPIRKDRHPYFVWNLWCDVAVAGAVWLALFGLALFALSAVARPQPASYPTGPRPSEASSSAGAEIGR